MKVANLIAGETSQKAYIRIRSQLLKDPKFSSLKIPSYYRLYKDRPAVESFLVARDKSVECFLEARSTIANVSINATNEENELESCVVEYTPSSFIFQAGNVKAELKEAYNLIEKSNKNKDKIYAARIVGSYKKYCD